MCLDFEVTTPGGSDPLRRDWTARNIELDQARVLLQSLSLFAPIARAYGLPS